MYRNTIAMLASIFILAAPTVQANPLTPAEAERIDASSTAQPGEPSLAELRAATAKYQDINVALAEGYILPMELCDTAEIMGMPKDLGSMGVHYIRPDLLGITAPPDPRVDGTNTYTDFTKPAVLIYEPQADGSLELVAIENLVFAESWKAAGNDSPPSFHGVAFDTMIDDPATAIDEAHNFMPHHDRHVWLYRENPNGVFAQYNPNVSCEHYAGGEHQHASN